MDQAHAFISYVRENSDIVDHLARDLREAGVKVWLDRNDIVPGQRWKSAISEAIQQGAFFIACYSKELNERQETYMNGELRIAIDRLRNMPNNRVWFIPVFLNETYIPPHDISGHETLRDINAVALYADWDAGLKSILRAMKLDDPEHLRALHLIDLIRYHPLERGYAIKQLAHMDHIPPEAVPHLVAALGGSHAEAPKDIEVRKDVIDALGKMQSHGVEVIQVLLKVLRENHFDLPVHAVAALAKIGAAAVPSLTEALRDPEGVLRRHAIVALGEIGPPSVEAIPALLAIACDEPATNIRSSAVDALGSIGPASVPSLIKALALDHWSTRYAVIHALGSIGPAAAEAVPALTEALTDPDPRVRQDAAKALGKIGPAAAEAVPALNKALSNPDPLFRVNAEIALNEIGRPPFPPSPTPSITPMQ